MDPEILHNLIVLAFKGRDNAYAPYSKFRVGAALLHSSGAMINGCNVENASYGGGICAERTAITKAVSEGYTKFDAVVVVSDVPSPSISPCGICRQILREFLPLSAPIYMISSKYPISSTSPPAFITAGPGDKGWDEMVKVMTLEELLPMSFGPEQLEDRS